MVAPRRASIRRFTNGTASPRCTLPSGIRQVGFPTGATTLCVSQKTGASKGMVI